MHSGQTPAAKQDNKKQQDARAAFNIDEADVMHDHSRVYPTDDNNSGSDVDDDQEGDSTMPTTASAPALSSLHNGAAAGAFNFATPAASDFATISTFSTGFDFPAAGLSTTSSATLAPFSAPAAGQPIAGAAGGKATGAASDTAMAAAATASDFATISTFSTGFDFPVGGLPTAAMLAPFSTPAAGQPAVGAAGASGKATGAASDTAMAAAATASDFATISTFPTGFDFPVGRLPTAPAATLAARKDEPDTFTQMKTSRAEVAQYLFSLHEQPWNVDYLMPEIQDWEQFNSKIPLASPAEAYKRYIQEGLAETAPLGYKSAMLFAKCTGIAMRIYDNPENDPLESFHHGTKEIREVHLYVPSPFFYTNFRVFNHFADMKKACGTYKEAVVGNVMTSLDTLDSFNVDIEDPSISRKPHSDAEMLKRMEEVYQMSDFNLMKDNERNALQKKEEAKGQAEQQGFIGNVEFWAKSEKRSGLTTAYCSAGQSN
jgi:hypothetical protein